PAVVPPLGIVAGEPHCNRGAPGPDQPHCIRTGWPHAPQRPRTRAPQLPRWSAPNHHRSPRCRNCPSACRGELLIGIAAFTVARGSICLVRALLALELVAGELGIVGE